MKKIICSSKSLAEMFEKFVVTTVSFDTNDFYKIYVKGSTLSLGDYSIDVESKGDWICEFNFKKIKRIKKVLKKLQE